MNINFRHLRAFVAVAEHLHFTKAAEEIYLTQPALSALIRQLEADLSVKLLQRNTRFVELTAIGREFYVTARKLLSDFTNAVDDIKNYEYLSKGQVTIAALPSLFTSMLPPILYHFRQQYPDIQLKVLDLSGDEIIAALRMKSVDFGISFAQKQKDIQVQALFQDELRLICSRQSLFGKRKTVSWAELEHQPVIAIADGTTTRSLIDATIISHGLSLDIMLEPRLMPTAIACVEAGLGATILPSSGIPKALPRSLVCRPLINPTVHREVSLLSLEHYVFSPAAQAFYGMLLSRLTVPLT